ncbi:MAG: hypothetical protein ACKOCD_07700 [Nitrospiraceae bacterium]
MGGKRKPVKPRSNNQPKPAARKINSSTIELILSLALGAFNLWGFTVNLVLGCILWAGAIGLLLDIVWRSQWTLSRSILEKAFLSLVVIASLVFVAWNPVRSAYLRGYADNEPIGSQGRLSEEKIKLFLAYAYAFDNYLGATNAPGNEERILDPSHPLRTKYRPNQEVIFSFGVANQNAGLPLQKAILHVQFQDDGLEVTKDGKWEVRYPSKVYYFRYEEDLIATLAVNLPFLHVKFPRPDTYKIVYTINGRNLNGLPINPIQGQVEVVLYE